MDNFFFFKNKKKIDFSSLKSSHTIKSPK